MDQVWMMRHANFEQAMGLNIRPPANQVYAARELRQQKRLVQRGLSCTHDRDYLVAKMGRLVEGRMVDITSQELILARYAQALKFRSRAAQNGAAAQSATF